MTAENNNKVNDELIAQLPELFNHFNKEHFSAQNTCDDIVTLWVASEMIISILSFMKNITEPFDMLYDIYAVDERLRLDKNLYPILDFTIVYQLL